MGDRLTPIRPEPGPKGAATFPDARKVVQKGRVNFHIDTRRYAEVKKSLVLPTELLLSLPHFGEHTAAFRWMRRRPRG